MKAPPRLTTGRYKADYARVKSLFGCSCSTGWCRCRPARFLQGRDFTAQQRNAATAANPGAAGVRYADALLFQLLEQDLLVIAGKHLPSYSIVTLCSLSCGACIALHHFACAIKARRFVDSTSTVSPTRIMPLLRAIMFWPKSMSPLSAERNFAACSAVRRSGAATLGADGGEHAAAAGFHQIEHDVADADHLPAVLGPGGRATHHQVGAELFQLDAAGATLLQIVERSLVNQQIRIAVGKRQRISGASSLGGSTPAPASAAARHAGNSRSASG